MAMIPMVERRDWQGKVTVLAEVREDLIEHYAACVPCKGSGQRWRRTGGSLWSLGWEKHEDFGCRYCCGRGIFRVQ